jgi:acetyltransferase-like isoleucine patch superfamily enzyme
MSADRSHAFAEGTTFPAPERMPSDDPRRATAEAVWGAFREVSRISPDALLGPRAWPNNLRQNPDYMTIGPQTVVRGVLRVERLGYISIDDHCYIGDGVIVSAHAGIAIAPDVLIAHGCQIFDNVSHPLGWQERARHYRAILAGEPYEPPIPAAPIVIERNAWIGMNSIIMRGVRIGARSIVAAGSVVVRDVPADTTVAGNPAEKIG